MKKISIPFWILGLGLFFTSCSTAVNTQGGMHFQTGQASSNQNYQIQVGDALDIKFFYHPELNESVVVRPDGRISLQLVQEVQASGLTTATLTENLQRKYESQIRKPEIAVIVRSFAAQKIYVDGEVAKPGLIPLSGQLTVLQSIASAGGFKDTARINEIILIRRGTENRPASMRLNMGKAIDGTDPSQDLTLLPSDIVYVPKSPVANVNVWVDQYIRRNIPIPFGVSFQIE